MTKKLIDPGEHQRLREELKTTKAYLKQVVEEHAKEDAWVERRFAWYRKQLTEINHVIKCLLEIKPNLKLVLDIVTKMKEMEWYEVEPMDARFEVQENTGYPVKNKKCKHEKSGRKTGTVANKVKKWAI